MGYGGVAVGSDVSYYQQMIDSITDYEVIRLDENGIVASWHPGAERLTGYTADEILGRPVSVFYLPEDIAAGLERVLCDGDLRASLVERGRQRVAHFSWERSVRAIHSGYMRVLGVRVPARPAEEAR